MPPPKIGLALGSGAARGWAHIGVIETLLEADIVPDIVCGTSIGALVGGLYAAGKLDDLKDWALKLDWRAVASMVDIGLLAGGLMEGENIIKWLTTLGGTETIENLDIPFAAIATDLTTGREVWLQSGALDKAIRASIAIPGIFSPFELDNRWLVDGGLVNPVPVSLCRALGADFIIAVPLNKNVLGHPLTRRREEIITSADTEKSQDLLAQIKNIPASLRAQADAMNLFKNGSDKPGYFDVLSNAIDIMQDHITRSRLASEPPHVQISPDVGHIRLMDFDHAKAAIATGRAAAEPLIPLIKARLASSQTI